MESHRLPKPRSSRMPRAPACGVFLVMAVMLAPAPLAAQVRGALRGFVRSAASGVPVAGAAVQVIGTNVATLTDDKGHYSLLSVPLGVSVVRITHRDYVNQSERVEFERPSVLVRDFEMLAPGYVLNEVVAQAMRRPTEVPDAALSEEELEGASSLREILDQVSGVTLVRTGGDVGSGWYLRIRGAKSFRFNDPPVVVLDGVRVPSANGDGSRSALELLSIATIGRVEVIRGAAASARYGPGSANGVIVITTKRGPSGLR